MPRISFSWKGMDEVVKTQDPKVDEGFLVHEIKPLAPFQNFRVGNFCSSLVCRCSFAILKCRANGSFLGREMVIFWLQSLSSRKSFDKSNVVHRL